MASDGMENTPPAAFLWAIYTDLHGFATRGALFESGQLFNLRGFKDLKSFHWIILDTIYASGYNLILSSQQ